MATYTKCPRCGAKYEVTTCPDGTTLVCDVCGFDIVVEYEKENIIPGGISVKTKVLGDGTKWLECPKCGFSNDITTKTPGNRFRCQRCNLLLQSPVEKKPEKRQTRSLRGEDILTCPGCGTKYNISGYTPGNRFRCRSCGLSLRVPERGEWTGSGDWEIDVEKGLLKCNGCGKSYPIAEYMSGKAFECKTCRKAFTPTMDLAQLAAQKSEAKPRAAASEPAPAKTAAAPEDEWDLNVSSGMIRCRSCMYTYDISGMKDGADFVCPRCSKVFKMPGRVRDESERVRVVCPKCGAGYDVSGYLVGTMFGCEKCDAVVAVGGGARKAPEPAPPGPRMDIGNAVIAEGIAVGKPPTVPVRSEPPSGPQPASEDGAAAAGEAPAASKPPAHAPKTPDRPGAAHACAAADMKEPPLPEESIFEPERKTAKDTDAAVAPKTASASPADGEEDLAAMALEAAKSMPDSEAEAEKPPAPAPEAPPKAEKVLLACDSCGQKYKVPPIPDGKKRKCKKCGGILGPVEDSGSKRQPAIVQSLADEQFEKMASEVKEVDVIPQGAEPAAEPAAEPPAPAAGDDSSAPADEKAKKSKLRKKHGKP